MEIDLKGLGGKKKQQIQNTRVNECTNNHELSGISRCALKTGRIFVLLFYLHTNDRVAIIISNFCFIYLKETLNFTLEIK